MFRSKSVLEIPTEIKGENDSFTVWQNFFLASIRQQINIGVNKQIRKGTE